MSSDSNKRNSWVIALNWHTWLTKINPYKKKNLAPSFTKSLVFNVVGLVVTLGLVLLIMLTWHGINGTDTATRQEVTTSLNQVSARLNTLMLAAEMTANSVERVARSMSLNETTLLPILETSLAAFEQRPELSYLGVVLSTNGEYVNIERASTGDIFLWHLPAANATSQFIQTFQQGQKGFSFDKSFPNNGYDARTRPFYQAALKSTSEGTWLPAYQWVEHARIGKPLWGFSFVKALKDESGAVAGVVDSDLDMPALNRFLKSLSEEYGTQIHVIEMSETPRLIGGPNIEREPQKLPSDLYLLTNSNDGLYVNRISLNGVKQWVAARTLHLKGGYSWVVVSSKVAPVIELSLQRQLLQVIGMGAAIVIALVFISLRMAYRFGKPLVDLESQVPNIEQFLQKKSEEKLFSSSDGFRETQLLKLALEHMAVSVRKQVFSQEQQLASVKLKSAIFDYTSATIFSLDHQLNVIEWNAAAERLFGIKREDVFGKSIESIVKAPISSVDWTAILNSQDNAIYQFVGTKGIFDAELKLIHFRQDDNDIYTLILNDITARKHLEEKLRKELDYADAVLGSLPGVFYHYDESLHLVRWNNNFEQTSGYSPQELMGADPMIFFADEDKTLVKSRIAEVMNKGESSVEVDYLLRDGRRIPYLFTGVRFEHDGHLGFVGIGTDITERKQAEQRIRQLALFDPVTTLPNRNLIEENIIRAIQNECLFSLLYINLDRFKIVNGGYGHLFGNEVLKATGEQLKKLVNEKDVVSRLGADKFLIFLHNVSQASEAASNAAKIIDSFNSPIAVQTQSIHLSLNIGISVHPLDGESAGSLINNAEIAMYKAKSLGHNTYQLFTRDMGQQTQRHIELEIKLRSAVTERQLHLVYQPKVNLKSGQISGCEALVRWNHPELGMISPMQFIPIAEDSGLIVEIGDWVLRTACLQGQAWIKAGLPKTCIAVNISARQFLQQDMVTWVARTLEETGLPPECLELELTESLIAQDIERVADVINQLKKIGVKLSIDDFGTGYSSLSYLKSFRVDTLKIDQSFVRNMLTEEEDSTIVLAVIALAHSLNFKVIAEGVETEQHCKFLKVNDCDEIQGYYFSKPVMATELESILLEKRTLELN